MLASLLPCRTLTLPVVLPGCTRADVARLDNHHLLTRAGQQQRGGQAGDARADHDYVGATRLRHLVWARGAFESTFGPQ